MEQLKREVYDLFDIDVENLQLAELEENLQVSESMYADIDYERDDIQSEYNESLSEVNSLEEDLTEHISNLEERIKELNVLPKLKGCVATTEILKYVQSYMSALNKGILMGGAKEKIYVMLMEALYGEDVFIWINSKGDKL